MRLIQLVHTLANLTDVAKEQEERGGKRIGAIFPSDNSNVNVAHMDGYHINWSTDHDGVDPSLGSQGKSFHFLFLRKDSSHRKTWPETRRETMMPEGKISIRLLASYDYEKNSFTSSLSRASHGKTWLATRGRQ